MDINNFDLQLEIKPYLDGRESLLWCDKPVKKIIFTLNDVFTTLFGIFWLAFSLFWVFSAYMATSETTGPSKIFPLFGIPFVLVGVYLLFFRHIVSYFKRKNIIYALTEKRVLVVHFGRSKYVQEYKYEHISNISLKTNENDVGSIYFFTGGFHYNNNRNYSSTSGIFGIKDTKKVYKILSQCLEKKKI